MAKTYSIASFIVVVISTLLISCSAHGPEKKSQNTLSVQGQVYCDPCRVGFNTPLSEFLAGAKVRLECKGRDSGELKYSLEGQTDQTGTYKLDVEGDHEEEICEIKLEKSPREDCCEPFTSVDYARILLTKNVGVVDSCRFANPLGFMTKVANPQCARILLDMGFLPDLVDLETMRF